MKRPKHLRCNEQTVNLYDKLTGRTVAKFPYDVTDKLDWECAVIHCRIFRDAYCERVGDVREGYLLIDKYHHIIQEYPF